MKPPGLLCSDRSVGAQDTGKSPVIILVIRHKPSNIHCGVSKHYLWLVAPYFHWMHLLQPRAGRVRLVRNQWLLFCPTAGHRNVTRTVVIVIHANGIHFTRRRLWWSARFVRNRKHVAGMSQDPLASIGLCSCVNRRTPKKRSRGASLPRCFVVVASGVTRSYCRSFRGWRCWKMHTCFSWRQWPTHHVVSRC